MFEQIITRFVSSFTECIWIKTFLYSITFVVLSTFCLSLLQMHFSASLFRTLVKKDYYKEKFKLNHNVVMKLLQKSWGKVDSRAETKMRMKWSIEIHTERYPRLGLQYFFNWRFLIDKIKYFDRITSATEVNDESL